MNYNKIISFLAIVLIIIAVIIFLNFLPAFSAGTPNVSLNASYSLNDGMKIKHTGGDTISVNDTDILVRPMTGFERYIQMSWLMNRSVIHNLKDLNETWDKNMSDNMRQFKPGETIVISPADLDMIQENVNGIAEGQNAKYGFNLTNSTGKTFSLSLIDKGLKEYSKSVIVINP